MLLDIINLAKVRRAIIFTGILLLTIFVQNTILSRIVILSTRAMIIPITVAAIGFFGGGIWGGVFGLIAGILTDLGMSGASVMMTILFPVIGFFSGVLTMFFMSRKLVSFIAISLGALILTAFCQMFHFLMFTDTSAAALVLTGALQTLWSVPFIFAIYFPCRKLSRIDLNK